MGKEKIREYAHAVGEENPVYFDRDAAKAAGFRDVPAPPMFAVVYSAGAMGPAILDPEVGINFPMMVHGGQEFVWGEPVVRRRHDHHHRRGQGHLREGRQGLLRLRVGVDQPGRRRGRARHLDQHREGRMNQGDSIPELRVTPDKYLPHRYAGASGDFNPIHIDPEFAKQVGLPGNILHGLYAMAQVARANSAAAGGDPRALKRLAVQFRGMGMPEQEIMVTGTVSEAGDGRAVVDTVAEQGGNQIIRNAEAELALDAGRAGRRTRSTPRTVACRSPSRQGFILRKVVEGHQAARHARGVEVAGRAGRRAVGALRPCAPSWRASRRPACSSTRTPRPGGCPPTPATASTSTSCWRAATCPAVRRPLELTDMRREVDDAMRATTEQLSQVTNLLALVSAPPIETATIHRVEVLLLQPQVAMVVVITSTGGVTKRVISYDEPLDPGLVDWAASYLNEALGGMDVGARMLQAQAHRPELDARERGVPRRRWRPPSPSSRTARATPCSWTAPRGCSPSTASRSCRSSPT